MRLKDQVALITAAGGEIESAVARRFGREGALVAICDSSLALAEKVADDIKKNNGKAIAFEVDICQRSQVEALVDGITGKWGRIDILVNHTGRMQEEPFLNMNPAVWKHAFETLLDGCFNLTQCVARQMAAQKYGRIINFSAARDTEIIVRQERAGFLSASAGMEGMTYALAKELGGYGITVNCIVPEFIDTKMLRKGAISEGLYLDDLKKISASLVALGRLGTPEEVAGVCLFLASGDASFVSGQVIRVKGGP